MGALSRATSVASILIGGLATLWMLVGVAVFIDARSLLAVDGEYAALLARVSIALALTIFATATWCLVLSRALRRRESWARTAALVTMATLAAASVMHQMTEVGRSLLGTVVAATYVVAVTAPVLLLLSPAAKSDFARVSRARAQSLRRPTGQETPVPPRPQ